MFVLKTMYFISCTPTRFFSLTGEGTKISHAAQPLKKKLQRAHILKGGKDKTFLFRNSVEEFVLWGLTIRHLKYFALHSFTKTPEHFSLFFSPLDERMSQLLLSFPWSSWLILIWLFLSFSYISPETLFIN